MPMLAPLFADLASIPLTQRLRGLLGIVVILGLVIALSTNRRAISKRVIFWGLALQWGFAFLVLYVPQGAVVLSHAGNFIKGILDSALEGSKFVFGEKLVAPDGPVGFVFAFRVLPTVIFVAAFFAVLYHLGVMQWIVRGFAIVMAKLMGASGAESLERRRLALPGPDRGSAHDPALPSQTDEVRAADRHDVRHGARLRGRDGGVFCLRRRAPTYPHSGDHDGTRYNSALEAACPRDRET